MQNDLPNGYEVFRKKKGHANAHETVHVQVGEPGHTAQRQRKNTEKNVKILSSAGKSKPEDLWSQIKKLEVFCFHWKLLLKNFLLRNFRF